MNIIIGGSARTGKSTLAQKLRRHHPEARSLSGDTLRYTIKHVLPTKNHLGIDTSTERGWNDFYTNHADEAIQELREQSSALLPYFKRYIDATSHESSAPLIIDSIDIWPESLQQIEQPYLAIFIVDTSPNLWRRIIEHDDEHSWVTSRGLTKSQIQSWAQFSIHRGKYLKQTCRANNVTCLDIAETSFETTQKRAFETLTAALRS